MVKKRISKNEVTDEDNDLSVIADTTSVSNNVEIPAFQKATGAMNEDVQKLLLARCATACGCQTISDKEELGIVMRGMLNSLEELSPQDAIEGRLIAQMYVLQERGMQTLGSSCDAPSVEFKNLYVNMSTKLFRTANETLDMLMRYRRKGEQRVAVMHTYVGDGGKAIIGGSIAVPSEGMGGKL